ncbi:MAG: Serine/threonine protein kinase PknB [Labilithrix sp.]|nr:Serine/threonine protein kinase PknB [Labilithrix sp.]
MGLSVDSSEANRIGATLRDKWVLEELLGVGGMASVYAPRHQIGRRDAIKILHKKIAESEQLRARFEQEAHAVNAFRHPGVVEIRDVDTTEDGAPFLVMELLEGESLAQRLNREHSVEPREMLEIAAQVLDALAAAHARGIIHRDIKPDNLFLSKDGKVKVLDFGIARVRSADKRALTTKAGVTLGTMAYMAPEQARGEGIDGRADVYAVGATIFRSLAGRIVHDVDSQAALVMRVIAHGAPRLRTVVRDIDPNIAAIVDRALAFELEDRYPDAATMLSDVRAVLHGMAPPYASTAPEIPERPRVSSLFDETPSEVKGKPTVMPAKLQQQQQREPTPAEAFQTRVGQGELEPFSGAARPGAANGTAIPLTRMGSGDIPADALPSVARPVSMPTRVSHEHALQTGAVPSMPLSERVVIVPSQRGAVSVQPAVAHGPSMPASGSEVATVYGHAPPPIAPIAPRPVAPPPAMVLTPFGELSAFIRKGPSVTVLAIGGGVAVLALFLMVVTIAWFVSRPTTEKVEAVEPSVVAIPTTTATPTIATTTQTARTPELPPPPPAPRRSRR